MSRTKKGSKPPGFDYWGKRPCNGLPPGATTKKLTHHIERIRGKAEIQDNYAELETERGELPDSPELRKPKPKKPK